MSKPRCLVETQYCPSVAYLACFRQYDEVMIDMHENYQKGSYRNRAYIMGPNGVQRLSVPLRKGKHEQQPVGEVEVAYDETWQRNHWRSILTAYGNAPFFEFYAAEAEEMMCHPYDTLWELNTVILHWLMDQMELDKQKLSISQFFYKIIPGDMDDLRNTITPEGPPSLPWFKVKKYPQVFESHHGFVENLSGLDVLFCLGPASGMYLEQCILSEK